MKINERLIDEKQSTYVLFKVNLAFWIAALSYGAVSGVLS